MPITISDRARQELHRMGVSKDQFLRVRVVEGGCSGMTYSAAIDSQFGDQDQVVYENEDGTRVVSDAGSALYLDGLDIDFSDDLIQSGFRFNNRLATHACGCGSSFRV
jgi:iron-sulfur cluster assembly protein